MRIIRFLDHDDNEWTGCDIKNDSASIITGDVFGNFAITDRRVEIKTVLAPFNPVAILCIGLNYKMHAEETGMALPEHPVRCAYERMQWMQPVLVLIPGLTIRLFQAV